MTQYTIKTGEKEADRIYRGDQTFVIRPDSEWYFTGNKITFLMIKNGKPAFHKIETKTYRVTTVLNSNEAPILDGWRFIAFKEIA